MITISASTYIYPIDNTNLIFDERKGNNRTLKKRDISVSNETATSVDYNNTINEMEELQKNILTSLNKILNDKQNELEKLTNIKAKLMLYLKSFGNISISNIISKNVTNNSKEEEYSNIYLYQFEINPQESLRKNDPNILEKYLRKLKKDIYEVVRDIAGIERLNASIPTNLKVLIRAMKYYVNKENSGKRLSQAKHKNDFRRGFDIKYRDIENDQPLDIIINMLDIVNNYASTGDILKYVSRDASKILYRIIKTFYTNEFPTSNSRIYDLKYNVLSNLKYIGSKWQKLTLNTSSISTHERLPILKFLYKQLSKDICKLNDILKSLQFANSRRMSPVDEVVGKKIVFQIANDLNQVNNLINKIIKMKPKQNFKNKNLESKTFKLKDNATGIKKSLFEKIKKLLKSSKKEIRNLFQRKVPKTEIVKHIENRKMNEINKKQISEYKEIMQRWQNNMNIMSTRSKRSAGEFQKFMNKIKHIIPGYLRGKVKPAIDKKKRNKTKLRVTTRKIKNRRHSKNKSVSTTPKIKTSKSLKRNHTKRGH
ncbi:unnamed protein product [Euphydryas editha]|uniref:Uncharacterized protein n=1 Tax=Euphydryas editha TaxID=104508 RepID=A0AAU9UCG0_EUPED|nr:unnamed protein product [Euphydryas editha]